MKLFVHIEIEYQQTQIIIFFFLVFQSATFTIVYNIINIRIRNLIRYIHRLLYINTVI